MELSTEDLLNVCDRYDWSYDRAAGGWMQTIYPKEQLYLDGVFGIVLCCMDDTLLSYRKQMPEEKKKREVIYWYEFSPIYGIEEYNEKVVPEIDDIAAMLHIFCGYETCKELSPKKQNFFFSPKHNVITMRKERYPDSAWYEVIIVSDYDRSAGKGNLSLYVNSVYKESL